MKRQSLSVILIFRSGLDGRRGRLRAGPLELPCALGRSGPTWRKREGDGGTPASRVRALGALYRADRMPRPPLLIPTRRLRRDDGWCDDPASRDYNRPIRLPAARSHEGMWREDALYDLVLDLSWNRGPAIKGRGSAIFLHSARPGFTPTEGCVAVRRDRVARLARLIGPRTVIRICQPGRPRPGSPGRVRPRFRQ